MSFAEVTDGPVMQSGIFCIFVSRHARTTMDSNVRGVNHNILLNFMITKTKSNRPVIAVIPHSVDIPSKCKRESRKPGDLCPLVQFLDYELHFQLHVSMERTRYACCLRQLRLCSMISVLGA